MKGCAIFAVVMAVVLAIGAGLTLLDRRAKEYEARFAGALKFVEQTIERSLTGSGDIQFYAPTIEEQPDSANWRIHGIVSLHSAVTGSRYEPYDAAIANVCEDYADPDCWRLNSLTLDGQPLQQAAAEIRRSRAAPTLTAPPAARTVPAAATPAPLDPPAASRPAGAASDGTGPAHDAALVLRIQQRLKQAGFDPGPLDGQMGPATRAAIEAYQRSNKLPVDGRVSRALLQRLLPAR